MVLKKLGYNRVGAGLDYSSGASLLGLKVGNSLSEGEARLLIPHFRLWAVNISMVGTAL